MAKHVVILGGGVGGVSAAHELIERGYLYIAQPPLYRVRRGKKDVYLKDQAALDRFFLERHLRAASLDRFFIARHLRTASPDPCSPTRRPSRSR